MKAADQVFQYEAVLESFYREGLGRSTYVSFPFPVEELFGTRGPVRVTGTFNGLPVDRALIPRKDGPHYLILNRELCRTAGLRLGDRVRVELQRSLNPDHVELPEELSEALDLEPGAREQFDQLSPGRQRNIAIYINQAKRPETRAQRAVLMLDKVLSGAYKPKAAKTRREE